MKTDILLLILGCYFVASQDLDNYFGIQDCESVYPPRGNKTHTYCLPRSPLNLNPNDTKYEISEEDKKAIVDAHNNYRASASNPTATNMEFMIWDDELASLAQAWAEQCVVGHDGNRYSYLYLKGPGQNGYFGNSNWTRGVAAWYHEVNYYTYGSSVASKEGKSIGHYTQVMQHGSSRVGCGYAKCNARYHHYLLCNYLGPNWSRTNPYTEGETCAACPRSCKDNLCNCAGLFCFNGGTKDIDNCTCTCPEAYFGRECRQEVCPGLKCQNKGTINIETCECDCYNRLHTGKVCDIKQCPHTEISKSCGTFYTDCKSSSVKYKCPYMCGMCTEDERPTCEEDELCHESAHGCKYFGVQATPEQCKSLGKDGVDSSSCHNNVEFGRWTCESCSRYGNVKKDYCPYMCGYCKSECGDLYCKNGGTMIRGECRCECPEAFTGTDCSKPVCTDMVCQNGGEIDVDTCTCVCKSPFGGNDCSTKLCSEVVCHNDGDIDVDTCNCVCRPTFGGADCSIKQCPQYEQKNCGSYYDLEDCTKYTSPKYKCPYMCGICDESERPTNVSCAADPNCHQSLAGCMYHGDQQTPEVCATIGRKAEGRDSGTCTNTESGLDCWNCIKSENTRWNYCPWMCGLCAPPCDGLVCKNGGDLDKEQCICECPETHTGNDCSTEVCPGLVCHNDGKIDVDTCSCVCRPTFGGSDCSIKQCPQYEQKNCGTSYDLEDCTKYTSPKYKCPYMCGICDESERPTVESCAEDPNCHVSSAGCIFIGQQQTPEVCATIGRKGEGRDSGTCQNVADSGYDCYDCIKYENVLWNYCPWMCGLCAP